MADQTNAGASRRTEAIKACIALADDRATCADALCARKGECQYPSDCPYDNPLAGNARAELTALEAEVAHKDAEIKRLTAIEQNYKDALTNLRTAFGIRETNHEQIVGAVLCHAPTPAGRQDG